MIFALITFVLFYTPLHTQSLCWTFDFRDAKVPESCNTGFYELSFEGMLGLTSGNAVTDYSG